LLVVGLLWILHLQEDLVAESGKEYSLCTMGWLLSTASIVFKR
jgi:hypothetical protein